MSAIFETFPLWILACLSGSPVSLRKLIEMGQRKVNTKTLVLTYLRLHRAGLKDISLEQMATHLLARGRLTKVVTALIEAHKSGVKLSWDEACAFDLAGHDVIASVRASAGAQAPKPQQSR